MRRRQQQQLKREQETMKTHTITKESIASHCTVLNRTDSSNNVPRGTLEQVKKIREALTSGKKLCDACLRIFDTKQGLVMHQRRWCKGK